MLRSWIIATLVVLLLSACQPKHTPPINPQNLINLQQQNHFSFQGKMSFSDGTDGGSGRIEWRQHNGTIEASFKAPLGSHNWELKVAADYSAKLINHRGDVLVGPSAGTLISEQLGWDVPWDELTSWVLGQPNRSNTRINWVDDGYQINESNWQINYRKLVAYEAGYLPHRMQARFGDYAIKLSVKKWSW